MSTKATIQYNKEWHLYEEIFVNNMVYLQCDNSVIEYEINNKYTTIGLPNDIIEAIVKAHSEKKLPYQQANNKNIA